jgi:cell division protein FtsB
MNSTGNRISQGAAVSADKASVHQRPSLIRRVIFVAIFALAGAYGFVTLRGPQGIPGLRDKWSEIRKVEEENANLQRDNEYRRNRIKKLELSPAEQELEIRKKLKLLRPGETSFILPDQPKQDSSQSTPPPPESK